MDGFRWIPDLESERLLKDSTKDAPTSVLMTHPSSFRGESILLVLLARNVLCRADDEVRHQENTVWSIPISKTSGIMQCADLSCHGFSRYRGCKTRKAKNNRLSEGSWYHGYVAPSHAR
jgi:hypothetical protein